MHKIQKVTYTIMLFPHQRVSFQASPVCSFSLLRCKYKLLRYVTYHQYCFVQKAKSKTNIVLQCLLPLHLLLYTIYTVCIERNQTSVDIQWLSLKGRCAHSADLHTLTLQSLEIGGWFMMQSPEHRSETVNQCH